MARRCRRRGRPRAAARSALTLHDRPHAAMLDEAKQPARPPGTRGIPMSTAAPLPRRVATAAEESAALDPVARLLQPVADALSASPRLHDLLQGVPLGHAAHPLLTDLPIGLWVSSTTLDLVGPRDGRAADRLLGLGILSA